MFLFFLNGQIPISDLYSQIFLCHLCHLGEIASDIWRRYLLCYFAQPTMDVLLAAIQKKGLPRGTLQEETIATTEEPQQKKKV